MHELSLMNDLMRKIETLRRTHGGGRVVRVRVALGAWSHVSPDHFREHFEQASRTTAVEGALLEIETRDDWRDAGAQDVVLDSVEVAEA
ncbi:MAG: hydrogenase/urease maturation nickel metallochaperone HypA [Planctomycetota bacterium]